MLYFSAKENDNYYISHLVSQADGAPTFVGNEKTKMKLGECQKV